MDGWRGGWIDKEKMGGLAVGGWLGGWGGMDGCLD